MRHFLVFLLVLLPWATRAADLSFDCRGQTRFVHRGAPSTYPADEERRYHITNGMLDAMPCSKTETGLACFGLTTQQAMRRVEIDTAARTVRDALELPTSELIFDGRCD